MWHSINTKNSILLVLLLPHTFLSVEPSSHGTPVQPISFNLYLPHMTQQQTTHTQTQPITHLDYNANNQSSLVNETEIAAKSSSAVHSTIQNTNVITLSTVVTISHQLINTVKQKMDTLSNHSKGVWNTHKYKSIPALLLASYMIIFLRSCYDHHYLHNTHLWGYWRHQQTDAELYGTPYYQITDQLLIDIQKRYMLSNDPTNFVTPLISFLKDIDQEEKILKRYVWYTGWLNKSRLRILFFCNKAKTKKATNLLARLQLVRTLFTQWMATQNIIHHSS